MKLAFPDDAGSASKQAGRHALLCTLVRQDCGSALIEFTASAILLFTLMFGILECSRAVYVYHFLGNAAQEAARYAAVRGASWSAPCASVTSSSCIANSSNVTSFVQSITSAGITKSGLGVSTTWPGTDATGATCLLSSSTPTDTAGCVVAVSITYSFSFASPLLPKKALALTSTAEQTIVQ